MRMIPSDRASTLVGLDRIFEAGDATLREPAVLLGIASRITRDFVGPTDDENFLITGYEGRARQ